MDTRKKVCITRKVKPVLEPSTIDSDTLNPVSKTANSVEEKLPLKEEKTQLLVSEPKHYTKLKLDKSVLLVDTSYWVYYRFFALRNWYRNAYPDKDTFSETFNWLEDTVFIDKYNKLFLEGLNTICNMWGVPLSNVVFCIDCPYRTIWRYEHNSEYKGTRLDSHKRNGFNSFAIFDVVKKEIIPKLCAKYKMNAITADRCEADDIAGNFSVYLRDMLVSSSEHGESCDVKKQVNVCILASDNDYIQVCDERIILVDGSGKQLCGDKKKQGKDKFLIRKILSGDVSDNISACFISNRFLKDYCGVGNGKTNMDEYKKCTPTVIDKIVESPESWKILHKLMCDIREGDVDAVERRVFLDDQFMKNMRMIDFKMLPGELKQELDAVFVQIV